MATQWRHGPGGMRTGLAYEGCLPVLELKLRQWRRDAEEGEAEALGLDEAEVGDVLEDVQMIEIGVLSAQSDLLARQRESGASGDAP